MTLIEGTLNTTIRTNERRALSEYISYYDDPNDDDNNLPTSVKVRTTGATGLGIEVDGVVTNLDSAIEQSFAIESLDDIFVVGNAVASGAESIEIWLLSWRLDTMGPTRYDYRGECVTNAQ